MTSATSQRKPRNYFETHQHPNCMTFDDGLNVRVTLPWSEFVQARSTYESPNLILMEVGDLFIEIEGHNLGPLYSAIEEKTLWKVRAQPEHAGMKERLIDSFVTGIRFADSKKNAASGKRLGQSELNFGGV